MGGARFCRFAKLVVALAAVAVLGSHAGADFTNGSFQQGGGTASQPFPGWTVEYRNRCGVGPSSWTTTKPNNHPASSHFGSFAMYNVNIPALCGSQMARINNQLGDCHETRISQTATLTPADLDGCSAATIRVCWIGVVESVNHGPVEQPYFQFKLTRTPAGGGAPTVTNVFVNSTGVAASGSGWSKAADPNGILPTFFYLNTCTELPVTNGSPGDTVKIEMSVGDCEFGGHGAMAYLDCAQIIPGMPGGLAKLLTSQTWNTAVTASVTGLRAGDFDGDGKCDLVDYAPGGAGTLRFIRSTGAVFSPPAAVTVGTGWTRIYTGDFDGDGACDVAVGAGSSLRVVWGILGSGLTALSQQTTWSTVGGPSAGGQYWVGDFNGDERDDICRDTGTKVEVALSSGLRGASLFQQFANVLSWQNSGTLVGNFYPCDYNADGRTDLMQSLPTGLHFLISTGSSFYPLAKWRGETPPPGGWAVGDFDCDGRCEAVQRTSTGTFQMLDIIPPPLNGKAGLFNVSSPGAAPGPYAVGDFDGTGQDDIAHIVASTGIVVERACQLSCSCLGVSISAQCDYPDRTHHTLSLTITNRTGGPIHSLNLSPVGSYTLSAPTITFVPPLQSKRRRTVTITSIGAPISNNVCLDVAAVRGGNTVCTTRSCFSVPVCDCMDQTSDFYCKADGSGTICMNYSVRNTGPTAVKYIKFLPAGYFFPNTVTLATPLATGQTFAPAPCQVRLIPPLPGVLTFTMQLLDVSMNLVCEESQAFDVPQCPTVLGECCIRNVGLVSKTQTECAMAGGSWTPPGISQFCPWSMGGGGGSPMMVARQGTYAGINQPGSSFIARPDLQGSASADIVVNAADKVELPFHGLDDESAIGSGVDFIARGSAGGQAGTLSILDSGPTWDAVADFSALGASAVYILASDGEMSLVPITVDGASAYLEFMGQPQKVSLIRGAYLDSTHGFQIDFDELTDVGFPNDTVAPVRQVLMLVPAPSAGGHFTGIGIRGVGVASLGFGVLLSDTTPCPADLTGDCAIDQADLTLFTAMGESPEADINRDGIADLADLSILLASLNTQCPCGVRAPSPCPGDANFDGSVTFLDVTTVLANYGSDYLDLTGQGDANMSGSVNFLDITTVLASFGNSCP